VCDTYERAAERAGIPVEARTRVIEAVREETQEEVVGWIAEAMHYANVMRSGDEDS